MGSAQRKLVVAVAAVAFGASACNVHIVGDSTAWLVQLNSNILPGVTMTESTIPNCGYGPLNGNRVTPEGYAISHGGYPNCVIDWNENVPDEPDDNIVAFVSIHDAMCSTVDGCLPYDGAAYADAHADLVATGQAVIWVEVPPVGGTTMDERITELNAAVAAELGCTLVPYAIREMWTWDGLHYIPPAALIVGGRLSELTPADACP